MKSSKIRFILAVLVAGLIGYSIGVSKIALDWRNYSPHLDVINKEPPPSVTTVDFSRFWNVESIIEKNYYDKTAVNPQKMVDGAISGMVDSFGDPFTMYLPPVQNNNFKQDLAGQFEGIGAELSIKDKQIIVMSPLDGSPAQQAGIKAGDAIVSVDGQSTTGWSLNDTVNKIRGPKGTSVVLGIIHKGSNSPVDIKIMRNTITVKTLTSWIKKVKDIDGINKNADGLKAVADEKVVYIRLSEFGDSANSEWQKMAASVSQQIKSDSSIKGVVFDLRNNPGGYLTDAVYIASEFIKDGVAVMQEDRNGDRQQYPVTGKGLLTDIPVVVLINKGSASASEIVSGALRDHGRAKLVGETSFGKGTVQEAQDLGGGAGLHVTVAKWLTPNGTWVHHKGLTPDVSVNVDTKDPSHDAQLEKAVETLLGQ